MYCTRRRGVNVTLGPHANLARRIMRCGWTLIVVAVACSPLPALAQASAGGAIRAVLEAQVAAWNRGDLKGFMEGYWHSPELTFYSGAQVSHGWDAALARYEKNYRSGGREMGKLDFSELEIHVTGGDAWVGGRWHLKMSNGEERGGLFTLIFRKLPEGWRIVHDHTS